MLKKIIPPYTAAKIYNFFFFPFGRYRRFEVEMKEDDEGARLVANFVRFCKERGKSYAFCVDIIEKEMQRTEEKECILIKNWEKVVRKSYYE